MFTRRDQVLLGVIFPCITIVASLLSLLLGVVTPITVFSCVIICLVSLYLLVAGIQRLRRQR